MFNRIPQWSHLILDYFLIGRFFFFKGLKMIFIFLQYLWVRNLMWLSWLFWLWDSVSWLSWEASQGSGGCWYRSFFYRLLDWGCISSQGRFLITDLVSLFVIGLLRFSISSCFSLGNLYVSRNLSTSFRSSNLLYYSIPL